jgi:hypothetical protein
MKQSIALWSALLSLHLASAQEAIPLERAQDGARILTKSLGIVKDAPLKMEVDLQKPNGFRAGDARMLVIPAAGLSGELVSKSGQEITPLGQLWMHKAAVAYNGKVTPNSKLRLVTVSDNDNELKVQLYFLGARRTEKGEWNLLVYAKDKEPLLNVTLKKADAPQEQPIELEGKQDGEGSGILTLKVLGKYKAELPVMKQED